MLDLGESRVEMDGLEKQPDNDDILVWYEDCVVGRTCSPEYCLLLEKGDELLDMLVARLVVRVLGDGVRGIRPPAVRVLKMP